MFKKQRYYHSGDVYNEMKDKPDKVTWSRYRNGKESGTYYETEDAHVKVPDGEIGPAVNMALVALFSSAGLIAIILIYFFLQSMRVA